MAELPVYPTDAAICRVLAAGPLPTAANAGRLAIPERTARHRLYRLRQSGSVVTGADGLHRLADGPLPALATGTVDLAADLAATGGGPLAAPMAAAPAANAPDGQETEGGKRAATGLTGGYWTVLAVLAAAAIGLAAGAAIRWRPQDPPPLPVVGSGGPWTGW